MLFVRPDPRRIAEHEYRITSRLHHDGVLRPPSAFRQGADRAALRAAHVRTPVRGQVRVLVVLVDFSDKAFEVDTSRFEELFFSTGSLPTRSRAR